MKAALVSCLVSTSCSVCDDSPFFSHVWWLTRTNWTLLVGVCYSTVLQKAIHSDLWTRQDSSRSSTASSHSLHM